MVVNPESPQWEDMKAQSQGYTDIGCGPGWDTLVLMTHYTLKALDPDYSILQVKEKFGGLRFYMQPSDDVADAVRDQMYEVERLAEALSYCICEECGTTNEVETKSWGGGYWIQTLCQEGGAEAIARRRARLAQMGDGPAEPSTIRDTEE